MSIFLLPNYLFNLSRVDDYLTGTSGNTIEIFIWISTVIWAYLIARFIYSFFSNWKTRKFKIFKDHFYIIKRNKLKLLSFVLIIFALIGTSYQYSVNKSNDLAKIRYAKRDKKRIEQIPEIKERESLFKDRYLGFSKEALYSNVIIDSGDSYGFWKISSHKFEGHEVSGDILETGTLRENESNFKKDIYSSDQWFVYGTGGWWYIFYFDDDGIVIEINLENTRYLN